MPTWWRSEKGYVEEAGVLCVSGPASRSCTWVGGAAGEGRRGAGRHTAGAGSRRSPRVGPRRSESHPPQVGRQAGRENLRSRQLWVGMELGGRRGLGDRLADYVPPRQRVTRDVGRSSTSPRLLWQMAAQTSMAK